MYRIQLFKRCLKSIPSHHCSGESSSGQGGGKQWWGAGNMTEPPQHLPPRATCPTHAYLPSHLPHQAPTLGGGSGSSSSQARKQWQRQWQLQPWPQSQSSSPAAAGSVPSFPLRLHCMVSLGSGLESNLQQIPAPDHIQSKVRCLFLILDLSKYAITFFLQFLLYWIKSV